MKRLLLLVGSKLLVELVMYVLEALARRSDSSIDDEIVAAVREILQEHIDNG